MNTVRLLRLGVDGGGTSTRAVVIDAHNRVLGRGEAAASNIYSVGIERAAQNVESAIAGAMQTAGVEADAFQSWGLGLAGVTTMADRDLWRHHLTSLPAGCILTIDEDAAAAQAGAFGGAAGAVCIAGTGSNCFGIAADGRRARSDGWGPLLGDRGSGYWIGQAALRAVCLMSDGCSPRSDLLEAVLLEMGVGTTPDLVPKIYHPDFEKSDIARLFPVVLRAAQAGDVDATSILHQAGTLLAQTSLAVLQTLQLDRVAVSGGVLSRDTPVRHAYENALRTSWPNVEVSEPRFDAAIGAALLRTE